MNRSLAFSRLCCGLGRWRPSPAHRGIGDPRGWRGHTCEHPVAVVHPPDPGAPPSPKPAEYLKAIASILPKEVSVTEFYPNPAIISLIDPACPCRH